MQEPTFDITNQAYFRLARQPAKEHQEEFDRSSRSTLQRDPLAQLSCRVGDAACAGAHADTLNRAAVQPAPDALLRLQRHYGNRFVQRVVALSRSGDGPADVAPEVEQTIQQARGSGQALDHSVRTQMEPALQADFSGVRVHTDGQADNLNRSLSARAFATGQDIFFKQGEYNPGSSTGRELLAHELTHVVQQNGDGVQTKLTVGAPGDRYEQEADSVARAVMQQEQQGAQRKVKPEEEEEEKPLQANLEHDQVRPQVEEEKEDEPVQMKLQAGSLQRQAEEEEKEEEPVQAKLENGQVRRQGEEEKKKKEADTPKDPKQVAHDLITTFDAEKGSGNAFPKLSKADIVSGLRTRVNSPQSINQAGLNACGPATAAYIFASSDPVGYVQMTINLFKTGVAKYHDYTLKAGSDLRSHGPGDYKWPKLTPEPVDWMVLSSLRDAENWFYDFEGSPSEDFSAITMPGEMQEWLKKFLGFKKVEDDTNLVSTKGIDHLKEVVNPKYLAGNTVVLFINANMFSYKSKKATKKAAKKSGEKGEKILAAFPNHFVVLKSEATVDLSNDNIEMMVWTWGGNTPVSCSKEVFENNYYGAIFAKK